MCCGHFLLIRSRADRLTPLHHVVLVRIRHSKHGVRGSIETLSASEAASPVRDVLPRVFVSPLRRGGGQQPVVPGPLRVTHTHTPPTRNTPQPKNSTDDVIDDVAFYDLAWINVRNVSFKGAIKCRYLQSPLADIADSTSLVKSSSQIINQLTASTFKSRLLGDGTPRLRTPTERYLCSAKHAAS